MMPIGPMMREHRLIERMIALLTREARRLREGGKVDTDFLLTAIQFIQFFADRLHHGKEEEILFRELKQKPLTPEHRRMMEELEAEHVQGRKTVERIALVRERAIKGEPSAPKDLAYLLEDLVRLYPAHIDKEDRLFFLPCMDYFSEEEQARMLEEGEAFDKTMLQQFFERILDAREGRPQAPGGPVASGEPSAGSYRCLVCGYVYDPQLGDPTQHVAPGTPFDQLPEGWLCPPCHVSPRMFIKV